MLGYVAEMILKAAFFRAIGFKDSARLNLDKIKRHASWKGRNLHNITSLVDVLLDELGIRNKHFDPAFAGIVKSHVLSIANHWEETLRYRHSAATKAELQEVLKNVRWLRANYTLLRS
ncbi:MAG: hypothetical protein NTX50_00135 [Candidatus Sumerlaeota bacterium]|nr:hypothetical protein [Candidatus Sumerlaeota bacterium]